MRSRTMRAFSRAAKAQERMEFGFAGLKVMNSVTLAESAFA